MRTWRQPLKAAGGLGQARMEGDFLGVWIVGPEIDHLVEDALVLFRHAAIPLGPFDASAMRVDGVINGVAQRGDLLGGEEVLVADVAVLLKEFGVAGASPGLL